MRPFNLKVPVSLSLGRLTVDVYQGALPVAGSAPGLIVRSAPGQGGPA
ncbi:MAG: hypothetical protein ABSB94_10765 [Syntrophorhabdales bacterium]|jgi:hypothetical protein